MKIQPTIILTIVLLLLMAGAGAASGWFAYIMGDVALKGVSQPDVSPSQRLTNPNAATIGTEQNPETELSILLDEAELIKAAEKIIRGQNQVPEPPTPEPEPEPEPEGDDTTSRANFDQIIGADQGITLAITNAAQRDGALLLDVNLKNESSAAVQFLYSFLEIRDQRGRSLSAITDGLPGELPANGQTFNGTIRIPTALLDESETLTLTLTDYPDQNLQLTVSAIPVMR
ncbi:MAG: hypothetical protein EA366_00540 [Spirulina sp. DLM2.Bin59]|nr:MAG: hypothetical protein EA366_00540 [Spirulina sp. DLM2.Bin59]